MTILCMYPDRLTILWNQRRSSCEVGGLPISGAFAPSCALGNMYGVARATSRPWLWIVRYHRSVFLLHGKAVINEYPNSGWSISLNVLSSYLVILI